MKYSLRFINKSSAGNKSKSTQKNPSEKRLNVTKECACTKCTSEKWLKKKEHPKTIQSERLISNTWFFAVGENYCRNVAKTPRQIIISRP